jgi:hypothetical protein
LHTAIPWNLDELINQVHEHQWIINEVGPDAIHIVNNTCGGNVFQGAATSGQRLIINNTDGGMVVQGLQITGPDLSAMLE